LDFLSWQSSVETPGLLSVRPVGTKGKAHGMIAMGWLATSRLCTLALNSFTPEAGRAGTTKLSAKKILHPETQLLLSVSAFRFDGGGNS
jgi:hypothetical protein